MKKVIYLASLVGAFLTGCHNAQLEPDDLAATIAGNWKIYYCESDGNFPNACTGSLTLTRIDATHLNSDYKISSGSPFTEISKILIIGKDTVVGNYGYYRHGELHLRFNDGGLDVRLKKEP